MADFFNIGRAAQAITLDDIDRLLTDIERRHVPYAQQRAVNGTLFAIRAAVQDGMDKTFVLRRPWAKRGVRVAKAPRGGAGAVYTLDWFMADQEAGGTRKPRNARFLWRPTLDVRRGGVIEGLPAKRPKTLLRQARAAAKRPGRRGKGRRKPTPFMATMKTGKQGLFMRRGSGRHPLVLLYAMEQEQVIPPIWRFNETATRVSDKQLRRAFIKEMRDALAGNRSNGKAMPIRSPFLDYLAEFPAAAEDPVRHFGAPG